MATYEKDLIEDPMSHATHGDEDDSNNPSSAEQIDGSRRLEKIRPSSNIEDCQETRNTVEDIDIDLALIAEMKQSNENARRLTNRAFVTEPRGSQAEYARDFTTVGNAALTLANTTLADVNATPTEKNSSLYKACKQLKACLALANSELKGAACRERVLAKQVEELERALSSKQQRIVNLKNENHNLFRAMNNITNSTSWWLTKPWRFAGRKIKALVNLKLVNRDLCFYSAVYDLEARAGGSWQSMGVDPQFLIESQYFPLGKGWYCLAMKVTAGDASKLAPEIYLDFGNGMEHGSVEKMAYRAGQFEVLFKVEQPVIGIRLDPADRQCDFSVVAIRLTPLNAASARYVATRSMWHKNRMRGVTRKQILIEKTMQLRKEGMFNVLKNIDRYINKSDTPLFEPSYERWIKTQEQTLSNSERLMRIESLASEPKISIVLPVYNSPEKYLRECIESVVDQSYQNWELCIANDASTDEHVQPVVEEYARRDSRIRVIHREENGHISAASNSALSLATGEYVGLLDHDDVLAKDALLCVADELNKHFDAKLIYSDEDKVSAEGNRFSPHFKSDWNLELLLSQNYICHFAVIEKALVDSVGGFRLGYEGSQDHDLILRCVADLAAPEIRHITKILYHWRAIEGSTAQSASAKSYSNDAGLLAVKDFVFSKFQVADVEPGIVPNSYRVRYPIPDNPPQVSLIIPTRDQLALTRQCLNSIFEKTLYKNYELVIVDNGSKEKETLEYFKEIAKLDNVRVLSYNKPFNYSAINNFAVENTDSELIALVNNDIEVISPEWLCEMVSHGLRSDVGCVGAKLYYPNDRIQHGGIILGIGGVAGHSHKHFKRHDFGYFSRLSLVQNLSAVTGACLLVRRNVFNEVGGLNEEELTVAFNDVDFCLKVKTAGYNNVWTPYAELYHHESVSRGAENSPAKIERFKREICYMKKNWSELLMKDPYYNPNLSIDREDFSIR